MFIFKIRKTPGLFVCSDGEGDGRGLGFGSLEETVQPLPRHYHQSASMSVCLSAYQSVWLSVALSNWSTAWRERQRSCEHAAGIWDVWHMQCWETYPLDKVYMWHDDQKYTDMLEPLFFELKATSTSHIHTQWVCVRVGGVTKLNIYFFCVHKYIYRIFDGVGDVKIF